MVAKPPLNGVAETGGKALLNDFWYFSSLKSTRKEKLLYDSLRRQQATALRTKPKHNQQTKQKICFPSRQRTHFIHARQPYYAGVQTMRARICSAFSCDMFARVVWLRLRKAVKPPTFALSFAARTCHAWLARLTRARRTRFGRRTARVLLADFWYFCMTKSTIKEKFLYVSSRANNVRPC